MRVSTRRFREAQTMTFTATNIYARYKACTVAPILTWYTPDDCCNPPRGKLRRLEEKKRETPRSERRRRLFVHEESWVTVFRKSKFPQCASSTFHLDLPGVIGHFSCNDCRVSSACEPHAVRCNVACCTCISSCVHDQVASHRCNV